MKSVLIICNSDLSIEPRVIRQILALKDEYKIYTLGAKAPGFSEVTHFNFDNSDDRPPHLNYPVPLRKAYSGSMILYEKMKGFYFDYYSERHHWPRRRKKTYEQLSTYHFDVIIAHHWDSLPLAYALSGKRRSKLIFNAHDYYSKEFEKNLHWVRHQKRLIEHTMSKYLPRFDLMFAAWTKIHDNWSREYNLPSIIINNATEYNDLQPQLKKEEDKVGIIHHGIANSDRKIENMIDMLEYMDDRFYLDLMLISSGSEMEYFNSLKQKIKANPRIKMIATVPTREIPKVINNYDIGLYILKPNGFNLTYSLPNKLFEFIQGRVASLITPNVEMKTIVEQYDLGWVSDDFEPEAMASKIKNITHEQINEKKMNAHKNAMELAAEKNYKRIKEAVKGLLEQNKIKEIVEEK